MIIKLKTCKLISFGYILDHLYERNKDTTYSFEYKISVLMIVWGLLWWFIAGFNEIARFVPNNYELKVAMLFIALTALAQAIASYKLNWSKISLSLVLLTPTILLLMLAVFVDDTIFASTSKNPMDYLGFIAWPIAIFVHLLVLRRNENTWPSWILSLWHSAGVWIVSFITIWAVAEWIDGISGINDTWLLSIIGLVIALIILGLIIWQLVALYEAGNPDPLMYIPILNLHKH